MILYIHGPANQDSLFWLSCSQQYKIEILYSKSKTDFFVLVKGNRKKRSFF